jgi:hypothetical protein
MDDVLPAVGVGSEEASNELPHSKKPARFHRSSSVGEVETGSTGQAAQDRRIFSSYARGSVSFSDEALGSASDQKSASDGGRGANAKAAINETAQQKIEEDDKFFDNAE